MSEETELPKGHPLGDAWDEYSSTHEYRNTKKWAVNPNHVDVSLWAAFCTGWYMREMGDSLEWQPIETAPKDGTKILISDDRGERFIAWWDNNATHEQFKNGTR